MGVASENTFSQLVRDLSVVLKPCSGSSLNEIDPRIIEDLMRKYKSTQAEWKKYALPDFSRGYTRNLVDEGNGKSNLLILVWTPGQGSPVHDHADAHCVMKILQGTLQETLYHWPEESHPEKGTVASLGIKRQTIYRTNQVAYMSDQMGLHSMSNPDAEKPAVSLHRQCKYPTPFLQVSELTQPVYTPPHASRNGCHIFDLATGKRSHVSQRNYFSEYGTKAGQS